jgi:hypothetical protein
MDATGQPFTWRCSLQAKALVALSLAAFEDGVDVEPDGKRRVSVDAAITAQTLREFAP